MVNHLFPVPEHLPVQGATCSWSTATYRTLPLGCIVNVLGVCLSSTTSPVDAVCFQEDNVGLVGHPVYPSLGTCVTKVGFCVDLYKTEFSIKLL